jgi:hypothetical protein
MPFRKIIVPSRAEPVFLVGRNPLRSTISQRKGHRGGVPGKRRYAMRVILARLRGMAVKCPNCRYENPEHVFYCGRCGESLREPPAALQGNREETDSTLASSGESPSLALTQEPGTLTGLRQYSAATIAALVGVILLILSLAFYVYYFEFLFLDQLLGEPWDRHRHDLMEIVARAFIYSEMIGEICIALAIFLLVHGSLVRWKSGMSLARMAQLPLSRMRLFITLALASITIAFGLTIFHMEIDLDRSFEFYLRLQALSSYLWSAAWVFVSIALFIVARRIQQGVEAGG